MTPDEKRKVAQLVAGIVVTDDVLDPSEERFVDKMLDEFDIASAERAVIFPILDGDEAAEALARMSPVIQTEVIALLIEAAAADGQIVEEEMEYLLAVATVAGVDEPTLKRRLDEALQKRAQPTA